MTISGENIQTTQIDSGSALFFQLNDRLQVQGYDGHRIQFGNGGPSGEFAGIESVLPLQSRAVSDALRMALNGQPAKVRYFIGKDGQITYCELHCFPNRGGAERSIYCFLLNRTAEEKNSRNLERKIYELDIISQAVRAFAETRNLSEILRIILLAVTSGPGLGFNRGFILLSNDAGTSLWGCLATGPSTPEEAGKIWQDLDRRSLSLEEILGLYKSSSHNVEDIQVNKLVASLKIPLSDDSNFIVKAAKEGRSLITGPDMMSGQSNNELKERFGTDCLAVVPLISRDNLQGVLLADNLITGKPITTTDLQILEIFARYASDAIENSRLYGRLEQQICQLKEANDKIIKSRENLIKAEKLSSVARMALEVAHEIRNPLTVIGGYDNSHLRKIEPEDKSKKILEIISKQVARIETALDRFSSVVSSSELKEGRFNLATLVRETLNMLSTTNSDLPELKVDPQVENKDVFIDQGLFYQAMMVILRSASHITSGMQGIGIRIISANGMGQIFITAADDFPGFAEEFYRSQKDGKGNVKCPEISVALEILQHYGGGLGIASDGKKPTRLYVELPLCGEKV